MNKESTNKKSGSEKLFDMLKSKGLMRKYKTYKDFDARNDKKYAEAKKEFGKYAEEEEEEMGEEPREHE